MTGRCRPKADNSPTGVKEGFNIYQKHTFMVPTPSQPQFETGLGVTAPNQVFRFTSPALTHRSCHECEAPT